MDTNTTRLECKLKEIILASRVGHQSEYSKSLTEDHLRGCAFGKNAFTLDDPSSGTTIFVPWKLHRPLELTFNKLSQNSLMTTDSFLEFVDDFQLFPNLQNTRKKDDILDYILSKVNNTKSHLNFEEFLLALFLLSKYRSSVQHTNEQYAFNNVLNLVLTNSFNSSKDDIEEHDLSLNLDAVNKPPSKSASKNLDGVIYHDNGLIVDTNLGKVYESPRKLETKDFGDQTQTKKTEPKIQPPVSSANATGMFDADLVKRLLEVLKDQNLLNDSKDLQDRLEREVRLRNDLELSYHERLSKAESEKTELNNEYVMHKVKFGKLQVDFETLEKEYGNYKDLKESQLSQCLLENDELKRKLTESNQKLEHQEFLKTRNQNTQERLSLETEVEVKLFSIFCVYKDDICFEGEFVIDQEQLVSFCVDFGLGESEPPADQNDGPKAKQAYDKVSEYGYNGKLTYCLFKEFLMNLGLLMKPELKPEEAFRYLVFQLVFSSNEEEGEEHVEDYHPVYVTDSSDPWVSSNPNGNPHLNQSYQHNGNNRFFDVEGRVWFNKPKEDKNEPEGHSSSTPRFD